MKSAILILNLVAALLLSGMSFADEGGGNQTQPSAEPAAAPAEQPVASEGAASPVQAPAQSSTQAPAPAQKAAPAEAPAPSASAGETAAPAPVQTYQPDPNAPHYDRATILKERDSKKLDLRYCLSLGDNVAIAKCAGE